MFPRSTVAFRRCTIMYFAALFFHFFICIVMCSDSQDSRTPILWTQTPNNNRTGEEHLDATTNKIQLKVYYETFCPASVEFFVEQLKPTVKRLGSHLDVHLIPYGHANTIQYQGRYFFRCQHGPRECYCNKVHACAIDVLQNSTQAIVFNSCLMQYTSYSYNFDYNYFVSVLHWCGYVENVRIHDIWKCVNGSRSSNLLKYYGDETYAIKPPYVPYLILDGSTEDQDKTARDLLETVCQKLTPKPSACFDFDSDTALHTLRTSSRSG